MSLKPKTTHVLAGILLMTLSAIVTFSALSIKGQSDNSHPPSGASIAVEYPRGDNKAAEAPSETKPIAAQDLLDTSTWKRHRLFSHSEVYLPPEWQAKQFYSEGDQEEIASQTYGRGIMTYATFRSVSSDDKTITEINPSIEVIEGKNYSVADKPGKCTDDACSSGSKNWYFNSGPCTVVMSQSSSNVSRSIAATIASTFMAYDMKQKVDCSGNRSAQNYL